VAQDTFGTIYKRLLLRAPDLDVNLARDFVKTAYRGILDKHDWSALRARSEWQIPASYSTGTAGVTLNSNAVTGTGTTWTTSMVGRQFKVGNSPFYTILTAPTATSLTLDRVYAGTTNATASYSISGAYVTGASDLKSLTSVIDPENRWRLRRGYTQEYLDAKDPQRSRSGSPRICAGLGQNSSGVPMYEIWPRQTSQAYLPYTYIKTLADLSADADTIIYPIDGDLVLDGALVECAKYPGTSEKPNPWFGRSGDLDAGFQYSLGMAMKQDQDIYLTDFYRFEDLMPYAPIDFEYLRNYDPFIV
jgi:hypothetical protein